MCSGHPSQVLSPNLESSRGKIREDRERVRGKSGEKSNSSHFLPSYILVNATFEGGHLAGRRCCPPTCGQTNAMDTLSSANDGDDLTKGSQSWLRDLWSQKGTPDPPPLARQSSRTSLPVFFDRDGRVGPTALWLKEPHSLTALSMERSEQDARESELARAAQVALEIAQVSVLCHPYHRIFPIASRPLPYSKFSRDDHGRALTIPS